MAKYLIHTYPKRLWYVEQYLIPSMLEQGIEKDDITIYNDIKCEGNLRACLNAFLSVPNDDHGTWHLQDDIIICKDFKERTERYDKGLVAGFNSFYDEQKHDGPGETTQDKMWFSFPCIRIPNQYTRECAKWVDEYIIGNPIYEKYWKDGKNDDWAFRQYLNAFHKEDKALNLAPNLVDHIDYLLGGGSGGKRNRSARALYFNDTELIKELEVKINGKGS